MTLKEQVIRYNIGIKTALQTVYDALNSGQQNKILNNPSVAALFDRYTINTTTEEE